MHGRILIVEDDLGVGKLVQRIAEGSGFEARLLSSPEPLFAAVDAWDPTHIALDLMMPEMDGEQILAELGTHGCRARIIISSGAGRRVLDGARGVGQEHGLNMVGELSKPYSAAALRALLVHESGR